MSRELSLDEIVTEFLLSTCRRCPPSRSRHAVRAALYCGGLATARPDDDVDTERIRIALTTGSVAEFYIEPILPHLGDIDVMFYDNTDLAIPRGHPSPSHLPAEFHNCVYAFEIIDSLLLPGYVYLELRYILTQCSGDDNYNAVEHDKGTYLSNQSFNTEAEIHGPAAVLRPQGRSVMLLIDQDLVPCMRCLSWTPQAADWPTRHRNYGWPDSATIDRVVSNGCDVVGVANRLLRQNELMGKYQWRLSFSRAEIVLINSWMPVQQIVYHALRFFIKATLFTDCLDNSGAGRLSNYHIKTLMLWGCELKSKSWWACDVNLMDICVQLLHMLAEWLTSRWCQHYFVNNCNLIDNALNLTNDKDQLSSIDNT